MVFIDVSLNCQTSKSDEVDLRPLVMQKLTTNYILKRKRACQTRQKLEKMMADD